MNKGTCPIGFICKGWKDKKNPCDGSKEYFEKYCCEYSTGKLTITTE